MSDDQNGVDAHKTGQVFVQATKYADWDDGSKLTKIAKEYVSVFPQQVAAVILIFVPKFPGSLPPSGWTPECKTIRSPL